MNKLILILGLFLILGSVGVMGALTDNIVSYYKLDNNLFTDSLGTNNGANTGTTNISGIIIDGRNYDGSDNTIDITGISIASGTDKSFSFWIKPSSLTTSQFLFDTNAGRLILALRDTGDIDTISFYDGTWKETGTAATTGSWQHIVFVFDGTSAYIYRNNVLIGDGISYTQKAIGGNTRLGSNRDNLANGLYGDFDEIGMWNRSLNSTEISELYNSGNGFAYPFITELTFSDWNMTSDGGNDAWATNVNTSVITSDSTFSGTVTTSQSTGCRIGPDDHNWTTMGPTRNFTTTGGTSQIWTVIAGDALSIGNQFMYVACNYSEGATADVRLNITYQPSPSITVNAVANNSVNQTLSPLLNITVTSDTEATLNVTFYNASDNSVICTNTSISNGSQATCTWSGLKSNTTYTWNATTYDGFSTALSGLLTFNTTDYIFSGTTKDGDGNEIGGSTVYIIDTTDDSLYATTISNLTGSWSYPADTANTFLICGFNKSDTSLAPDVQLTVIS